MNLLTKQQKHAPERLQNVVKNFALIYGDFLGLPICTGTVWARVAP